MTTKTKDDDSDDDVSRYGVAKLLQEMRVMERHPIMRITEEVHRREHDDQNKG